MGQELTAKSKSMQPHRGRKWQTLVAHESAPPPPAVVPPLPRVLGGEHGEEEAPGRGGGRWALVTVAAATAQSTTRHSHHRHQNPRCFLLLLSKKRLKARWWKGQMGTLFFIGQFARLGLGAGHATWQGQEPDWELETRSTGPHT
jgi:hypothetical protein